MALRRELLEEPPPKRTYKYAGRRPCTRLDFDTIEKIAELTAAGNPMVEIAKKLLLLNDHLREWKRRGDIFVKNAAPENWAIYGDLVLATMAASGDYAIEINKRLHTRKDDWFRFFKIAERRMPHVYGRDPLGGHDEELNADDQYL
jgi:hypothetical protein